MAQTRLARDARHWLDNGKEIEPSTIERQIAIVVGIDHYEEQFQHLENAADDAVAMGQLLGTDYGFELFPSGVPILDEQAHWDSIHSAVTSSLRAADMTTRWLFFFAGHGLVQDGRGYLIPANAISGNTKNYLSIKWLLQQCLDSRCGEILIILDACYGGRALVRDDQLTDYIPESGSRDNICQLVASGNPDQPVLDGGGSSHSIFTQALLESLQGWSGIHDSDGSIRFSRLLDQLVLEIPARLRDRRIHATRQQPIGGNLVGNRMKRDFTFQCVVPRLPPATVRGIRSDDPGRRCQDISRLVEDCKQVPERTSMAVKIAAAHLLRTPSVDNEILVTATLRYEPEEEVRAEACRTLGALGDRAAADALVMALDDEPTVCRAAAKALGQLRITQTSLPLLYRLATSSGDLSLDLVDAIGAIGDRGMMVRALYETKRQGRLLLFVGPDFLQELTGVPDRATLARRLAKREGLPTSNSLAKISGATMRGGSRHTFTAFLQHEFDDQSGQLGKVYEKLAALGISFWLSGAYDNNLAKILNANQMVTGEDTKYQRMDRPTMVCLVGTLGPTRDLVVLQQDYEMLRPSEHDRQLLLSYLRRALNGKVVLFMGYDPWNPDFTLLVEYVLNSHLAGVDTRSFLVWPKGSPKYWWDSHEIRVIQQEPLVFLKDLNMG